MSMFGSRLPALGEVAFRRYLYGQAVSQSGTWMQNVGQAILVLQLTSSGTALGLVTACQYVPLLALGPIGGLIVDRMDTRRALTFTQSAAGALALVLGLLTVFGGIRLTMVYGLALALGMVNAIDVTARQTFVFDLVDEHAVPNAVALTNTVTNAARVVGPSLAGLLAATVGVGPCFLANAVSYTAMILVIRTLPAQAGRSRTPAMPRRGQLRQGFRYVRQHTEISSILALAAVFGIFTWQFQVTLALLAIYTFHGGPAAYGSMTASMAIGSVIGGVLAATVWQPSGRNVVLAALGFGAAILLASAAPNLAGMMVALVFVGVMATVVVSLAGAFLQLASDLHMRGRVVALWTAAMLGLTLVGAPLVGWVGDHVGPRYAFGLGGVAAIGGALLIGPSLYRSSVPPVRDDPMPGRD